MRKFKLAIGVVVILVVVVGGFGLTWLENNTDFNLSEFSDRVSRTAEPTPIAAARSSPTATISKAVPTPKPITAPRAVAPAPTATVTRATPTPTVAEKINRVYETVNGDPALTWTQPPSLDGNVFTMSGVLDRVVPVDDLGVTVFWRSPDSQDGWCGDEGKPWSSIVKPPAPGRKYTSDTSTLWCYPRSDDDDEVSGKQEYKSRDTAVPITFPKKIADTWRVDGRSFTITAHLSGVDAASTYVVTLWAGPEELADHVVERSK